MKASELGVTEECAGKLWVQFANGGEREHTISNGRHTTEDISRFIALEAGVACLTCGGCSEVSARYDLKASLDQPSIENPDEITPEGYERAVEFAREVFDIAGCISYRGGQTKLFSPSVG